MTSFRGTARVPPRMNPALLLGVASSSLLLSSLEMSDTPVYEPAIQALLGTALQFCVCVGGGGGYMKRISNSFFLAMKFTARIL